MGSGKCLYFNLKTLALIYKNERRFGHKKITLRQVSHVIYQLGCTCLAAGNDRKLCEYNQDRIKNFFLNTEVNNGQSVAVMHR